jgi:cytoskeletal protein CcmA (bactofilin family)
MFGLRGFGGGKRTSGILSTGDDPVGGTAPESPGQTSDAVAPPDADRLVIGPGLTFEGAIATCHHLVIAGRVSSDVAQCQRLEIAPGGSLHGRATVMEAEIAGDYEGELKVLGPLRIHAAGRVKGRITYGSLAIEPGGRLLGIIDSVGEARGVTRPTVVPFRSKRPARPAAAPPADNDGAI